MKKIKVLLYSIFISFALTTPSFAAHLNFTAYLTGDQEVPNVVTNAKGSGAVTLTGAGGLRYSVTVSGLSGPITAAHFHMGALRQNGGIVFDITSTFVGNSAVGSIAAPIADSVIAAFLTGRMYLNVHTSANPTGEIRGQVNLSAGTHFAARMDGLQEVPSIPTNAKGIGTITLGSVGSVGLGFSISVNDLSGPITAAHFHLGNIGQNGPVVFDITSSFNGNNAIGVWRTGTGGLADSLIVALLNGRLYLNVHTAANPGGEIRGQVILSAGFGANANLNGASENPPVITSATATAEMTFTDYGLVFKVTADGLSGPITAAHFHNADSGVNGPVVFDITSNFAGNTATGRWKASNAAGDLTAVLMKELFNNRLYINIHTAANPTGEIRGQVKMKTGSSVGTLLNGGQETPVPIVTSATGTAALYTVPTGLQYFITVTGLSGPITGAHFHLGSIREGGPVVKDIQPTFAGNTASGIWTITDPTQPFNDSLRRHLVNGRIYINIHTAANPSGEIRGQAVLTAGTGMMSNLDGIQENPPVITGSKGTAEYTLTRGGLGFNIAVNGLSGPIAAAHFHLGEVGKNGPVIFDITSNVNGNNIVGYWRPVVTIDSQFNALLNGRIYVNVHTAANPGGEIRGQVILSEGIGIVSQLTGGQEVPPVTTNARGTGAATLTDAGLVYFNTFDGLIDDLSANDSPPFSIGLINAPAGSTGPLVSDLTGDLNGNSVVGAWKRTEAMPISNALVAETNNSNIAINLLTNSYPNGEIRGQLRTGALNPIAIVVITSMILSPRNSINPINTQHCVTAAVLDQTGAPVRGATVQFARSGANPGAGSAVTDSLGNAVYCYTGTNLGRDTIIGSVVNLTDTVFKYWDEPLPVELLSFTSTINRKNVTLYWITAQETNNFGFEIERSKVGSEWSEIGFMQGNGTTNESRSYTFTDRNLTTGKYNYRLKQIDFNGNFEYFNLSNEIEIGVPNTFSISQNYPNPFNPNTKIDFDLPNDGYVKLTIYDMSGREVLDLVNGLNTAGYYTINFTAANLSSGIYFYKINYNTEEKSITKVLKMTVLK